MTSAVEIATGVNAVRGAEVGSEIEPFGDLVDDDDLGGACRPRDGRGIDAQPTGALDDDGVAQPNIAQCEQHLGQSTIQGRDGLVGKVLGHLVQRLAAAGVVELAVGGDEVRSLLVGAVFAGHQVLARIRPATRTCMTLPAEPKVRRHHAITDRERLSGRVSGEAFAEFGDLTDHLVTHGVRTGQRQLTPKDVQVGSADSGHPQFQGGGFRCRGGQRKLGKLYRPPDRGQQCELGHGAIPSSVYPGGSRIRPLVGTPVPEVTNTCSTLSTWL